MNTYKIILLSFLWLSSYSLFSQKNALEYHIGFHQIALRHGDGRVDRPNDNNYTPRFGVHYYHKLDKNSGFKTGIQLINEPYKETRFYNDATPTMPQNLIRYEVYSNLFAINIPASFRKYFNQGNLRFFMELGLSLNLYWKERNEFIFYEEIPAAIVDLFPTKKFIAYDNDHQIGVPINLSIGARYNLNDKFGLTLQPFLDFDASRQGRRPEKLFTLLFGVQMGFVQFL